MEIKVGNFCKVCEFEEFKDREVFKKILLYFMKNIFDLKNLLNMKNNRGDLFFIYCFILVVCNKIVLDFLSYKFLSEVFLIEEFYEYYFFFLLVLCVMLEKIKIVEYILNKYLKDNI